MGRAGCGKRVRARQPGAVPGAGLASQRSGRWIPRRAAQVGFRFSPFGHYLVTPDEHTCEPAGGGSCFPCCVSEGIVVSVSLLCVVYRGCADCPALHDSSPCRRPVHLPPHRAQQVRRLPRRRRSLRSHLPLHGALPLRRSCRGGAEQGCRRLAVPCRITCLRCARMFATASPCRPFTSPGACAPRLRLLRAGTAWRMCTWWMHATTTSPSSPWATKPTRWRPSARHAAALLPGAFRARPLLAHPP